MRECKHEYKEVKQTTQEAIMTRYDYRDWHIGTIEKPLLHIFCVHCGDYKEILSEAKQQDV